MHGPTPFGRYILLDRISVGGMAEVHRGKTTGVEGFARRVAVKRILPHLAEDHRFVQMFIAEAKMASGLQHANIAQVMELGRFKDEHFIAMEYVSGRDLLSVRHHLRKRREHIPLDLGAYIAAQVAEGLAYAHDLRDPEGRPFGIVHRDVSPQNVLLSYDGAVKLIDFGIAKAATSDHPATRAGVLKGKFSYMSPEQIEGRAVVDHRADIFALGAVLHELLTNERLFDGENDFMVLERVRAAEVLPPSQLRPELPVALDQIVLRALAREPADRYAHAGELAEALSRFVYGLGLGSPGQRLRGWLRETFAEHFAEERAREAYDRRIVMTSDGQILELPEDVDEDEPTELWAPSFDELDRIDAVPVPDLRARPQASPEPRAALRPEASQGGPPMGVARAEDRGPAWGMARDEGREPSRAAPRQAAVTHAPTPQSSHPPPSSRLPATLAVVGLLAALAAGAVWWFQRAAGPETVELTLRITPGDALKITLDGEPLAERDSPIVRPGLAPGKHPVTVERTGYARWSATLPLGARPREAVDVQLRPLAPTRIHFDVQPPDAEITINGRSLSPAERRGAVVLPVAQPAEIELSAPGYTPLKTTLIPGDGPTQEVRYALEPTPGQLFVDSRPPADIYLDGRRVGRTPLSGHPVDVSRPIRLRLQASGHAVHEEVLHFKDKRILNVDQTLHKL